MIKNYFKIAWRNRRKNKIDSFISICGLAVGIACCLLLVAYVQYEWSFDDFHKKGDRIYRVYSNYENSGEIQYSITTPLPLAGVIESTIPEVAKTVRWRGELVGIKINGKFRKQRVYLTETGYFDIFTFPLISGNAKNALSGPSNIVITREKALKIFGNDKVIGETLMLRHNGAKKLFTISGIAANIPDNSSIAFDFMLPYKNSLIKVNKYYKNSWLMGQGGTYVLLHKKTDVNAVNKKLQNIVLKHGNDKMKVELQSLDDFYMSPVFSSTLQKTSKPLYAWILACLALVVLAIAAINFMSLSLSRATTRMNEISLRKTVGATRGQLIKQFIGEAFLTCLFAFLLSGVLAELATSWFQNLIDKPVSLGLVNNPVVWIVLLVLFLFTVLVTGGYPALVLSGKRSSTAFHSRTSSSKIPVFVKGLIVIQFMFAITFLSAAAIMFSQLHYMASKDLGYQASDVIAIEYNVEDERAGRIAQIYAQEVRRLPDIQNTSVTSGRYNFFFPIGVGTTGRIAGTTLEAFKGSPIIHERVGKHFLQTMDIELKKGKSFSTGRNEIIVNEQFAEAMGWQQPIGKIIHDVPESGSWTALMNNKKVIGVVENYNFKPLTKNLTPLVLLPIATDDDKPNTILVEFDGHEVSKVIAGLTSLWNKLLPEEPFTYSFMEDLVASQYKTQTRWKSIITFAAVIAILLACFGLFGLANLSAERRTKEIGIRKVLGATVTNIVGLLSKDFLKLVAIGFVIAVPIAWYAMNKWLADFAYRIDIGAGIFMLAGGLALLIALATVSWQSVRAALANPVDSLRSE